MVGKAWRRREKNYRAAHGGPERLPPPPSGKDLDAIPSKLRRLMAIINTSDTKAASQGEPPRPGGRNIAGKSSTKKAEKVKSKKMLPSSNSGADNSDQETLKRRKKTEDPIEPSAADGGTDGDTKRKRKRKVKDLRFEMEDLVATSSRKKRRKLHLKERKKKKQNKNKPDAATEFPGKEKIRFGDVVEAPPKLSFPKVSKGSMDASSERLRLQAIEEYRKRRGWTSRPGIKLPEVLEKPPL